MRLKLLLITISALILGGCSLVPKKSGLEVISYPPAKVYINNKEMGVTPYKNNTLKPGEVEVKLVTNDNKQWIKKVTLQNNINTVVDWEFGNEEKYSGGYILYLEKTGDGKKAGLMINTTPDKTAVAIDNEIKGYAPLRISNIGNGDRQLTMSFPGKKSLNLYVKAINGYQLVLNGILSEEEVVEAKANDTPQPTPELNSSNKKVKIKNTETGWLRVRETAASSGKEIARVYPNDEFPLLEESGDWYKIDLSNNKSGWISTTYAEKVE